MGHCLQAFICTKTDSENFAKSFKNAISISLGQGIALVPMTEELFDEINNSQTSGFIKNFKFINENIEEIILKIIENKKLAYVESEYFGSTGSQKAIIWNQKNREQVLVLGKDNINNVLKYFGVIADEGIDEFQTLGFHNNRSTQKWIENTLKQNPTGF
ncbi:hypothetical protein ASE40_19475 [Flavobacterium sp. Root935]|uniref:hypothetical protein n=1 Tax=Flavobacterium sp. Root935 TaxID=1736610 RepID=UPI00070E5B68|nr:hypothetical protein [Flavobacterium sp. Root935]KRD58510.1 hypothetical protein ASE40_19475 [Flavobacterium sp. Root935]